MMGKSSYLPSISIFNDGVSAWHVEDDDWEIIPKGPLVSQQCVLVVSSGVGQNPLVHKTLQNEDINIYSATVFPLNFFVRPGGVQASSLTCSPSRCLFEGVSMSSFSSASSGLLVASDPN